MLEGWRRTLARRAWEAAAALLMVGAVASSAMADWQDVVEPELAGMVLEHAQGERVLIVELDTATSADRDALERSYTYTSCRVWNSSELAIYRSELDRWCGFAAGWSLRRLDHEIWERTSPYLAFSHALVVSCSIEDIPHIAGLPFVERILDGEKEITFAHSSEGTAGRIGESELRLASWWDAPVDAARFAERIGAHGWLLVEEASIDALVQDQAIDLIVTSGLPEVGVQEWLLTGLGTTPCPPGSTGDSEELPWPLGADLSVLRRPTGATTRGELLWLVDAALHAGASSIALCTAEHPSQDVPLALLWAPLPPDGWAAVRPVSEDVASSGLPAAAFAPLVVAATRGTHAAFVLIEWEQQGHSGMTEVLRSVPGDETFTSIGITADSVFRDVSVETCIRYAYRVRSISEDGVGVESERSRGYIGQVPETVATIQASDGDEPNGIRVEWTPAEGATEYVLYRSEPVNTPTQHSSKVYLVYRGPATEFLDTDVVMGTIYRYTAIPHNGCGASAIGNPANQGYAMHVELPDGPIVPPQWFRATLVSPEDHVGIAWCPVQGAEEYQVYRASSYAGPYECVHTTALTMWDDDTAEYCQDYWYRIQAVGERGVSALSAVAHGVCGCKPGKPLEFDASEGIYPDAVRLEWEVGDQAEKTWVLRANESNGPYTRIGETEGNVYFDSGLVPGQQFWYRLEARNECGGSGWTAFARGSTTPE